MADTPKPRGWRGSDRECDVKSNQDGHVAPYYEEVSGDQSATYDPSNPRRI